MGVDMAVTLHALTIDGQAFDEFMFERVPEEDIVDLETMSLRGVAWGRVNWSIDDHPDVAINLFWVRDGAPRRCVLYRQGDTEYEVLVAPLFDLPQLFIGV
jgi:hypothetical protein